MWLLNDAQDVVHNDGTARHLLGRLHANVPRDLVEVDPCDVRHGLPRGGTAAKTCFIFAVLFLHPTKINQKHV